jgi:hypothetical protein
MNRVYLASVGLDKLRIGDGRDLDFTRADVPE